MCGCLSPAPYWGPDLARNPGMCPKWESNWLPFGSQARGQATELHQLGPFVQFIALEGLTALLFIYSQMC